MKLILSRKEFSSKKKNSKKKNEDRGDGTAEYAGAVGAGVAGTAGVVGANIHFGKNLMNSKVTAKDEKAISEALKKRAKSQGIEFVDLPDFPNSAYVGGDAAKKQKDHYTKKLNEMRKQGKGKQADMIEKELNRRSGGVYKHLGDDKVVLGKGSLSQADVLSHEIGHAQYMKKGRSKNIIAKGAHKTYVPSKILSTTIPGGVISAANGFASGVKSEKAKQEGKKESTWNKVRHVAVPAAMAAPMLVAEAAASRKGLKMMKEAGASKELMKQSKKRLGSAFGTYASMSALNGVAGVSGRLAGKGYAKRKKKEEEELEFLSRRR